MRFRHALLRDVAYEGLAFRRRRVLHGRAAELIADQAGDAADERAEILAIHYHAAHRWPESWRFSRIAGDQAVAHGAPGDAAGFLRRAIEAGRMPTRSRSRWPSRRSSSETSPSSPGVTTRPPRLTGDPPAPPR